MSKLINETDEYLELERYIHDEIDEYSRWELNTEHEEKYPSFIHESEHFAFYEIKCIYRINKKTGEVTYLSWE
jgi:hypothetical protein